MNANFDGYISGVKLPSGNTAAIGNTAYGICQDSGSNRKVSIPGFKLLPGTTIYVKFLYRDVERMTLNVEGTGSQNLIGEWRNDSVVALTFNNGSWIKGSPLETYIPDSLKNENRCTGGKLGMKLENGILYIERMREEELGVLDETDSDNFKLD